MEANTSSIMSCRTTTSSAVSFVFLLFELSCWFIWSGLISCDSVRSGFIRPRRSEHQTALESRRIPRAINVGALHLTFTACGIGSGCTFGPSEYLPESSSGWESLTRRQAKPHLELESLPQHPPLLRLPGSPALVADPAAARPLRLALRHRRPSVGPCCSFCLGSLPPFRAWGTRGRTGGQGACWIAATVDRQVGGCPSRCHVCGVGLSSSRRLSGRP
mmetsp:Transcript_17228/g.47721  ORF Transcript_17228/g.47721 Transcript_17228/m.47721 type:complete len:218 (+) Transcript_17228:108-761(+)